IEVRCSDLVGAVGLNQGVGCWCCSCGNGLPSCTVCKHLVLSLHPAPYLCTICAELLNSFSESLCCLQEGIIETVWVANKRISASLNRSVDFSYGGRSLNFRNPGSRGVPMRGESASWLRQGRFQAQPCVPYVQDN